MASCVLLGIERLLAKTDAMLLMTVVAAMCALPRAYLPRNDAGPRDQWINAAMLWTALAGGVLLKGPLIVMIAALAALTLAILDRSARWLWQLKPIPGGLWRGAPVPQQF